MLSEHKLKQYFNITINKKQKSKLYFLKFTDGTKNYYGRNMIRYDDLRGNMFDGFISKAEALLWIDTNIDKLVHKHSKQDKTYTVDSILKLHSYKLIKINNNGYVWLDLMKGIGYDNKWTKIGLDLIGERDIKKRRLFHNKEIAIISFKNHLRKCRKEYNHKAIPDVNTFTILKEEYRQNGH